MPPRLVRRTHLVLRDRAALERPPTPAPGDVHLARRAPCTVPEYRELYRLVGERWHWRDRLAWSDARLAAWLSRDDVAVWVLAREGRAAGFFELRYDATTGSAEIVYFGLADAAQGRGLGGWMLVRAVEEAWAMGAERVHLNTCTLDGPAALPNYLARGFVPYRTEEYVETGSGEPGAGSG